MFRAYYARTINVLIFGRSATPIIIIVVLLLFFRVKGLDLWEKATIRIHHRASSIYIVPLPILLYCLFAIKFANACPFFWRYPISAFHVVDQAFAGPVSILRTDSHNIIVST